MLILVVIRQFLVSSFVTTFPTGHMPNFHTQVFEYKPLWPRKKGRPASEKLLGYLLACRLPPPYNIAQVKDHCNFNTS